MNELTTRRDDAQFRLDDASADLARRQNELAAKRELFDTLPQRLILRLEIGILDRAAPRLQIGFGLLGTRAPARQLLGYVSEDGFELIDGISNVRPVSGVRQIPPPALSAWC